MYETTSLLQKKLLCF